jgi:hypothetical protein
MQYEKRQERFFAVDCIALPCAKPTSSCFPAHAKFYSFHGTPPLFYPTPLPRWSPANNFFFTKLQDC